MIKILIINGPNLNLLGTREKNVYGNVTLDEIEADLRKFAGILNIELEFIQSNSESEIINAIHNSKEKFSGIVINPAAYTHTSIAIMDAISAVNIPTVEVHLSNIHSREEFRHNSYPAKASLGQICGFGKHSYLLGLQALSYHLSK